MCKSTQGNNGANDEWKWVWWKQIAPEESGTHLFEEWIQSEHQSVVQTSRTL